MTESRISGIDHVQVAGPPGCEEDARRFYGDLLGLEEIPKPETLAGSGGVWFTCGPQELHVGVTNDFMPAGKAHPALLAESPSALSALATRLREAGAPVEEDDRYPSRRRFFTRDPWGNRLELVAVP